MRSAHKNQMYSHTLMMNNLKMKFKSFHIRHQKKVSYLGMSLTRSVKLTLWKRKTLLKETKCLNKWNATHVRGWEGLLLPRWGDSPNSSTELRRSHQTLSWHLRRKGQANPKIHMEIQGAQNSQNNIDKEQSWGARTSWCPKRPQSSGSQDSVALPYGRTGRCHRSESPEINSCV